MTLQTYLRKLTALLEKNPQAAKYKVIFSSDDEGNSYHEVCFAPSIGFFEDGEYECDMSLDEHNAVCLN